jgi:energy-coupling factor transporter ATP-binding protein EcfA2
MHIQQIVVSNYRSLKDVTIGDLSKVVVLYGENNSGKSNVLSFLEQLFKRKRAVETVTVESTSQELPTRVGDFWQGFSDNFADNFYENTDEPIAFAIHIELRLDEIKSFGEFPEEFLHQLVKQQGKNHLILKGRFNRSGDASAQIELLSVELNKKSFYELAPSKQPVHLKGFPLKKQNSAFDGASKLDIFERMMGAFNDAFLRVSPDRFISSERELTRGEVAPLAHSSFKNWLFQMSMNRENERTFRDILGVFENAPFSHGRVTLARTDPDLIDIFVEEINRSKLPIGRKGSGIQQILMILSFVSMSQARFLGIEEPEINLSPKSQMAIFDNLFKLVQAADAPLQQVIMTTHSPRIASRNEAARRGVWMKDGQTQIRKPGEAEITEFFTMKY